MAKRNRSLIWKCFGYLLGIFLVLFLIVSSKIKKEHTQAELDRVDAESKARIDSISNYYDSQREDPTSITYYDTVYKDFR